MTNQPTSLGVRLAEVVASVSLATDLATGQALEHGLRRALLATWLGEEIGLPHALDARPLAAALPDFRPSPSAEVAAAMIAPFAGAAAMAA